MRVVVDTNVWVSYLFQPDSPVAGVCREIIEEHTMLYSSGRERYDRFSMTTFLVLAIHFVTSIAKVLEPGGARGLLAETLLVKHQLVVINRSRHRAPNLTSCDRVLMGLCSLFMKPDRIRKAAAALSPVTLFKFHEALKKRKYRLLFSGQRTGKSGPKGPSRALIDAIVEMKRRNPPCGCRRIAQQIAKAFGVEIDKDVVRGVLEKYYRPGPGNGGPSWLTFIGHRRDSLWSADFFRCESITLKTHWVPVVMDEFTRRIIGLGMNRAPWTVSRFAECSTKRFRGWVYQSICPPTMTRCSRITEGRRIFAYWMSMKSRRCHSCRYRHPLWNG